MINMSEQITEADLERYLWNNPKLLGVDRWIARQFKVPSGIIDLLGISKYYTGVDVAIVVELKRNTIDGNAIAQVCRYAADIEYAIMMATENYAAHVLKMVVGRDCSNSSIFEARAMDVRVRFFQANVEFNITGDIEFTPEYKDEIKLELEKLGENKALMNIYHMERDSDG